MEYNLYTTNSITGRGKNRLIASFKTEKEVIDELNKQMEIAYGKIPPYVRCTLVSKNKKTYDYGSHTNFFLIKKVENENEVKHNSR